MKRSNRILRAAGVLLVCTMVTSTFVGGTFAKYVTKAEGDDTARVAKWGVEVKLENGVEDIFKDSYLQDWPSWSPSNQPSPGVNGPTVSSIDTVNVVAPGTSGTLGQTTITGTPEVAVKVETIAEVTVENWDISSEGDDFYCPLIFTIDGIDGEQTLFGLSSDYASDFEYALENAIEDAYKGEFVPNTDLAARFDDFSISWEWPYAGQDEDNDYGSTNWTSQPEQTDVKDTALGNKAAEALENGLDDDAPSITIKLTITITQVD